MLDQQHVGRKVDSETTEMPGALKTEQIQATPAV